MTDSYDELPYSKFPYPHTHPDRLATVAALHGLSAPSPAGCRVLELGCGAGGNLIPLAYVDRDRRCVGVDRAAGAIADGTRTANALGLPNVELLERDLLSIGPGELGEFDYIVAHGVYTWVPPHVREAVMATMSSHLAPEGIAFVSYNAQPGGSFRRMLGAMGSWHARYAPSVAARAEAARELFAFLLEHRAGESDAYGAVLARELPRLVSRDPSSLIHDELGEGADAIWFHELVAEADRHLLEFVGESVFAEIQADRFPPGIEEALRAFTSPGRIAFEQYSDLLIGRKFRQTLLCRAGRTPSREPTAEMMPGLHFAAPPGPVQAAAEGLELAALDALGEVWPHSLAFGELHERLDADTLELSAALLAAFRAGRTVPRVHPPVYATTAGERPLASALARLQVEEGPDVTSLRHDPVRIEEGPARRLLTLLDGTRDRDQIRADLAAAPDGLEVTPDDLDANLHQLALLGLLHG